jgi:hypothetical protein
MAFFFWLMLTLKRRLLEVQGFKVGADAVVFHHANEHALLLWCYIGHMRQRKQSEAVGLDCARFRPKAQCRESGQINVDTQRIMMRSKPGGSRTASELMN